MEPSVFMAIIAAAAMHAGWNALLKIRLDPFVAMALITGASSVIVLPVALALGPPPPHAWAWIAGSIAVHLVYYLTLTGAYRRADMGFVYPVARGGSPLITTLFSLVRLGEPIDAQGVAGVALLATGVFAIAWPRGGHLDRRALVLAGACALSIAVYSIIDGTGARATGNPHLYAAWLFLAEGPIVLAVALLRHGSGALRPMLGFLGPGAAGGAMSLTAYWITIWAMTKAPIGLVSAVRESSVLFAALIAVFLLKEPPRPSRLAGAALIVAGLALIKLH
ncbi:EamA family transporter [Ancylobacter oerskovii]|uniref:EamA family transporter n=1 Tax=Ancylobacter oerskovii TaxID=459519 RepID=A0ABW4YY82_9HYPH|nr:EamA family transporter [Ancylobacter oerskovii]MBS7541942.1 EamA family transporter [Ancylobacter oerskovii]